MRLGEFEEASGHITFPLGETIIPCLTFLIITSEKMTRIETRQKYLTVPAAIRELEKIEMVRRNNGSYKLEHAVTKTQKIILSSFGLDETDISKSAEEYSKQLSTAQSLMKKEAPYDGEEEIN